jgi:hypothetical protein
VSATLKIDLPFLSHPESTPDKLPLHPTKNLKKRSIMREPSSRRRESTFPIHPSPYSPRAITEPAAAQLNIKILKKSRRSHLKP